MLVLPSIRRPKRVTIRGNDEKEHRYLVKCGEDLRQDQRIEQLLELMNGIYSRHAACRQKHFRIRTYQVVPMTPRCDEWTNEWTNECFFLPCDQKLAENQLVLYMHQLKEDNEKTKTKSWVVRSDVN